MNHAEEVAKSGREIIKVTKEYNENLITLHNDWVAALLGSDPNCRLTSDMTIPVREEQSSNPGIGMCVTPREENRIKTIYLNAKSIDRKIFKENEQILSAFSDYLTALTAYTSDEPSYSVSELVDKALENADNINKNINLNDKQKKSISGLVSFLQRLATEEKNKGDIATVLKEMGPKQSENLDLLRKDIEDKKDRYFNAMSGDILHIALLNFNKRAKLPPQQSVSPKEIVQLNYTTQNYIKNITAAEVAINKYQEYNKGLLSIIEDDVTDKKIKEEMLDIQKKNIKEGLGYVKDFVQELGPVIIAAM
ncbi:hypothetical protein [Rahnella aceris]|uniref:Uncharacterized protein n=1 Tax=Rahnella sp. (strain Y9602) TaxID=2703885 RepID=A0ABW6CI61_RAHSY